MKNIIIIILIIFPLIISFFLYSRILKIDSELIFTKFSLESQSLRENIGIDKHASKRRVYFFSNQNKKLIKFERKYSGLFTSIYILNRYNKYQKNNLQEAYLFANNIKYLEKLPFFSLNEKEKNIFYFYDIFLFLREKYYFTFIFILLAYIFGGGYLIDFIGGISENKTTASVFLLATIYFILLIIF